MPIDYKKYGPNWKILRYKILDRAQGKCELCSAGIKEPHPITGSKVVLTVHHVNFNIQDNRDYNLIALCQRCHLRLDMPNKVDKRKATKRLYEMSFRSIWGVRYSRYFTNKKDLQREVRKLKKQGIKAEIK